MTEVVTSTAARFVGQSVRRREDPRLLTGRGRYVDDVTMPRLLHAHYVRSPVARGTLTDLDVTAARELAGVAAVLTAADVNHQAKSMWNSMLGPDVDRNPVHAVITNSTYDGLCYNVARIDLGKAMGSVRRMIQ